MQTLGVDQLVGRTVGEYQIEQLLGQSQLGTAYMARQRSQGRTVIMTMFNFPEGISARERDQITTHLARKEPHSSGSPTPRSLRCMMSVSTLALCTW